MQIALQRVTIIPLESGAGRHLKKSGPSRRKSNYVRGGCFASKNQLNSVFAFWLSARQKGLCRRGVRDRDVGCSLEQLERLLQWPNDGSRGRLGASRVLDHPDKSCISIEHRRRWIAAAPVNAGSHTASFIMLLY